MHRFNFSPVWNDCPCCGNTKTYYREDRRSYGLEVQVRCDGKDTDHPCGWHVMALVPGRIGPYDAEFFTESERLFEEMIPIELDGRFGLIAWNTNKASRSANGTTIFALDFDTPEVLDIDAVKAMPERIRKLRAYE